MGRGGATGQRQQVRPAGTRPLSLSNACARLAALLPHQSRRGVWADSPDTRFCGSLVGPGGIRRVAAEGWRVTGRWRYVSGSRHAEWAVVAFSAVDDSGETTERFAD